MKLCPPQSQAESLISDTQLPSFLAAAPAQVPAAPAQRPMQLLVHVVSVLSCQPPRMQLPLLGPGGWE